MFSIQIEVEGDFKGIAQAAKTALTQTQAVVSTQLKPKYQRLIVLGPGKYPGSPKYPLRWKSQKQRRYVMAKLRREGNLPYQRTNAFQQAWYFDVNGFDSGFEAEMGNRAKTDTGQPLAQFIVGQHQQPFHADTGWPNANGQLHELGQQLAGEIVKTYRIALQGALK